MNLKKVGCGALVLILSLSFAMPINSYASANFSDTTGHWAEGFIVRAFDKEFVDGYPNGRFMPDKYVTRAEFVSMVNKAFDIEGSSYETRFSDVSYSNWYYNEVLNATSTTYAGGYSDETFRPNVPITREEAAVMLSKILPSSKKAGNMKSFKDYKQIDTWAVSAFEKLIGRQYMGAYNDGKIHPKDPLTRAQTAKILCDILDNETIVTSSTVIDKDKAKITGTIYTHEVIIGEDLGEGSVTIDNCIILGDLTVEGGGNGTVTINNSRIPYVLVNKDDKPVRIVTKGETNIASLSAKQSCVLQTSGKNGTGIQEITVNKGADLTLKGIFPVVNIEGLSTVTLESGKITTLTVNKGGKYSDITLTGKAEVTEATVNAESYFHGAGTIAHMNVNADNITYETKPDKMTVSTFTDRALGEADTDSDIEVEFDPDNKDTNIDLDAKITLTFNTSIKLASDTLITTSNIKNFVTLRTVSKGGIEVECTGIINTAKKVVTLTPKNELTPNTKYYVVLADETIMNAGGSKNDDEYIYFTTGTESSNSMASFDPDDGDTGISAGTSITIRFSDDVVMYSSGAEVTDAYLQQCIVLKKGNATSGTAVTFTASISSRDKITIKPTTALTAGQKYYVAVITNKFKTKDSGKAITGSSATWTVAGASTQTTATPVLSSLKLTPAENSIDVGFTPNVSGTVYAYATTSSSITDTQIMTGKSATASASTPGSLTLTGLNANTKYYVYALLKNSTGTNSAIVSASTTTTIVDAALKSLTLSASGKSNSLSGSSTNTYSVEVPYGTTTVDVAAIAETTALNAVIKINGTAGNSLNGIPVSGSSTNKITLTVSANNKTTATYVINVTVAGNTDLGSLSIDGVLLEPASSNAYATTLPTSVLSALISVVTEDTGATITIEGVSGTGSFARTVTLGSGYQTVIITVTSNTTTKTYTVQFFR